MRPGAPRVATAALVLGLAASPVGAIETAPEPADWTAVGAEAARLLAGYVQVDTSNPPGRETAGAVYLKRFFDAEGIPARMLAAEPGRASLVARLAATAPDGRLPILLLSHVDVVPAEPEAWAFAPFSGAIRNGAVHGRGALDDKGQGVSHALALALLARHPGERGRDVVFAATAAEEAGAGLGADWLVEHHWSELGPPAVVWNEGGVSTRNAMTGDRILNAIATSEKRSAWMTLGVEGEGGHGSQPPRHAAVERLVAALARLAAHPTPLRITPTVGETMRRLSDSAAFPLSFALRHLENPLVLRLARSRLEENRVLNAMVRDTVAVTGLRAGIKHNVIPRRAEATLDVRLLPDTDSDAFLAWLRAVIDDPAIRIELTSDSDVVAYREWRGRVVGDRSAPLAASPAGNELFRALEAELARELPGSVTVPVQTTGGTDSKYFRARGVPAYGYFPALLPEELVSSVHGLDERIPIVELERAVRVTYRTLRRLVR